MDKPIDIERACKLVRDVAGALGVHEAGDMALTQATSLVLAHHESLQDRALKAEESVDRLTAEVARIQGERDTERALRLALEQERSAWISNRIETLENVNSHLRTELAGAQSALDEQRAANAGMRGQLDQHADACKRAGERIPVIERERDAALADLAALKAECERAKDSRDHWRTAYERADRDYFALADALKSAEDRERESKATPAEIPDWNRCDLCGVRPSAISGYCADCDVIQHAIDTRDTGELAPLLVNRRKKNQHTNAADTKARGLELELAAERERGKTLAGLLEEALPAIDTWREGYRVGLRDRIAAALANHPAPANGRDE